ncbi:hypothetical protein O5541_06710 [Escherichia coli]|nr:hypothetical protein [Escherichia coli]
MTSLLTGRLTRRRWRTCLGVQEVEASIETLRNYIDWTPFLRPGRCREVSAHSGR